MPPRAAVRLLCCKLAIRFLACALSRTLLVALCERVERVVVVVVVAAARAKPLKTNNMAARQRLARNLCCWGVGFILYLLYTESLSRFNLKALPTVRPKRPAQAPSRN